MTIRPRRVYLGVESVSTRVAIYPIKRLPNAVYERMYSLLLLVLVVSMMMNLLDVFEHAHKLQGVRAIR